MDVKVVFLKMGNEAVVLKINKAIWKRSFPFAIPARWQEEFNEGIEVHRSADRIFFQQADEGASVAEFCWSAGIAVLRLGGQLLFMVEEVRQSAAYQD